MSEALIHYVSISSTLNVQIFRANVNLAAFVHVTRKEAAETTFVQKIR